MKKTVTIIVLAFVALVGWGVAFTQRGELHTIKNETTRWKKIAQDANMALFMARSGGESPTVLLPKGSIIESTDGGKTFRINEIGK